MKILFFYTYNQSFLAAFYNELALALSERNWDVQIFSLKREASVINSPVPVIIKEKKGYLKNGYEIFKAVKDYKPDIIVSNFSYVNAAVISGKLLGVKKNIIWFHTLTRQINPNGFQITTKSVFLKLATHVIVNSPLLKEDLVSKYSLSPKDIFALPFWSPLEDLPAKNMGENIRTFKIGCPGRMEPVKNQKLIFDSLAKLDSEVSWELYLAGDGSFKSVLEAYAADSLPCAQVYFLGTLKMEEMKRFYEKMDLIILPSFYEAFGLVLIEALSLNCPVLVSSSFGALKYIKDERFLERYIFDPKNPQDLTQKIRVIHDQGLPEGKYFRNIYKSYFRKEEIMAQFIQILSENKK